MSDDDMHDRVKLTLKVINHITQQPTGEGEMPCPKCGGTIDYFRRGGGKSRHAFAFQCRTKDCISGRGH